MTSTKNYNILYLKLGKYIMPALDVLILNKSCFLLHEANSMSKAIKHHRLLKVTTHNTLKNDFSSLLLALINADTSEICLFQNLQVFQTFYFNTSSGTVCTKKQLYPVSCPNPLFLLGKGINKYYTIT